MAMAALCVSQGRTEGWVRRGQNGHACCTPCRAGMGAFASHQCMQHGQEAIVQQENYGLVANTEAQWDHSHD